MFLGHNPEPQSASCVRKLWMGRLHNNAFVERGILVTQLHRGTPGLHFSAIYIVSAVGGSLLNNAFYNVLIADATQRDVIRYYRYLAQNAAI